MFTESDPIPIEEHTSKNMGKNGWAAHAQKSSMASLGRNGATAIQLGYQVAARRENPLRLRRQRSLNVYQRLSVRDPIPHFPTYQPSHLHQQCLRGHRVPYFFHRLLFRAGLVEAG